MNIEAFSKTADGVILVDHPEKFPELLQERQMRDAATGPVDGDNGWE